MRGHISFHTAARRMWQNLPFVGKALVVLLSVGLFYAAAGHGVEEWLRWDFLRPPIPSSEATFLSKITRTANNKTWSCPETTADVDNWIAKLAWRADLDSSVTGMLLSLDRNVTLQTYTSGDEFTQGGSPPPNFSVVGSRLEGLATKRASDEGRLIRSGAWVRVSGSFVVEGDGCPEHGFEEYANGFFPIVLAFRINHIEKVE
jgi:hypothetical protein